MRTIKAQNLIEYAIILALVVIVVIIALNVLGFNTDNIFKSSSIKVSGFRPFGLSSYGNPGLAPDIIPGSLGGTLNNPKELCQNNFCSIDNGDYVLKGLPENFTEFIETAGPSGGTEIIAAMLDDLVKQMEQTDNDLCNPGADYAECAEGYRQFANTVHLYSSIVQHVEDMASVTPTPEEYSVDYFGKHLDQTGYKVPDNLKNVMPSFSITHGMDEVFTETNLGAIRNVKNTDPAYFKKYSDKEVGYGIIDSYDKIMKSSYYSEKLKTLTEKIYLDLNDLMFNTTITIDSSSKIQAGNYEYDYWDPITGLKSSEKVSVNVNFPDLNNLLKPQFSYRGDKKGGIICNTGLHKDTGKYCN